MSKGGSATLQANMPTEVGMTEGTTVGMTEAIGILAIRDVMREIGRRWFQLLSWGLLCIGPIKPTANPRSL